MIYDFLDENQDMPSRNHHKMLLCSYYRRRIMAFFRNVLIFMLGYSCLLTQSMAEDCKPHQLPDGTWTTECPSQSPPPPPAAIPTPPPELIPSAYAEATCHTSRGICTVRFHYPPVSGTPCSCRTGDEPVHGQVWTPASR